MRRGFYVTGIVVFIAVALAAAAHLILKVGWLWTLLVAPIAILLLGLTVQAAGILSREEPK